MLASVRAFFASHHVLEVDCPALSPAAPIDLHIDVMRVEGHGYLHTSPEYGMKQLLAKGSGDIYQLSHVFRAEETGPLHNPEFTMIEWYRVDFSFEQMIEETLACCRLFLGALPHKVMRYSELIQHYLGIDYKTASCAQLYQISREKGLMFSENWDKDTLLQALIAQLIEPHLGSDHLFVLTHFPASQAALSRVQDGEALRFEVYHKGIELANGYHELTDPIEQRKRLVQANADRVAAGKPSLPLDETFLAALEAGIPDCCGVAVGFDRLLQLQRGEASVHAVLPLGKSPQ